ncbi:hypothetical protein TCAL_00353 [Tigriopus californicus]|uniref:SAM domain-containing protein n=1 Tax=Tigriopus californicus TaxID=6832 RepID=A0A553NFA1_TIGCA|nr:uncharacterized protein LOC131888367 [Tigriopus californicus]TRY64110.1 hypothetical protein TCAL_00353 [Tigriopus californicus]|eukprot:TCALIF_00353-PA protein Name:"Similar to ASZ1 Ankyrin repeat, SAM and basic leucine zipper domain-containing protein 1 (Ornithorhynchus anatinus)" AED:0.04 eAED:0.10 QI:0/-1/0/1/-1/1/1/0/518
MSAMRPAGYSDDDEDEWGDSHQSYFDSDKTPKPSTDPPHPADLVGSSDANEIRRHKAMGQVRQDFYQYEAVPDPHDSRQRAAVRTSFIEAILNGNLEQMDRDLASGLITVNVELNTFEGTNPIFMACNTAQKEVLKYLLSKDASLAPDPMGSTPVMALVSAVGLTSQMEDFERRIVDCLDILRSSRPDSLDVNQRSSQRMTALMFAAKAGRTKVVDKLIQMKANLDLRDSQEWTALCFAVDAGHGHVARVLLNAGADPDFPTRDGMLAADLASARGQNDLRNMILSFSEQKPLVTAPKPRTVPETVTLRKFSGLDNVLMGLNLSEYMHLFQDHALTLEQFLTLTEDELLEIGISKVGVRKQIMDCICDLHKADWQRSSLAKVSSKDKQRKIFFTCPDCISMTANMAEHLKYLSSTLEFLTKQISEHPEILSLGQDVGNVSFLLTTLGKFKQNLGLLTRRYREFDQLLRSKEKTHSYQPASLIVPLVPTKSSWKRTITFNVTVIAGIGLLTLYLFRRFH